MLEFLVIVYLFLVEILLLGEKILVVVGYVLFVINIFIGVELMINFVDFN